ncbi:hypothetical protein [Rhodococcus coprophilus]|uniref:hypothetical protein n=1 Tax=Rhodococcus coprophilus TaxID=38310 RepID=UPI001D6DF766|nr:hypothetical protein [Rhodococcus coprophilus]MBM7458576.1 hypothetical protein [Rhodococcus coprophilus]
MPTDKAPTGTPGAEDGSQKLNKEARYRVERNEARETVTALQARFERLQRAEVERIASAELAMGSDLFTLSGNTLTDYLDDDGNVDPEKVAADVAAVLTERPGLRKNAPAFDPSQGTGGSKPKQPTPSWDAMFK